MSYEEGLQSLELPVTGMSCAACARTIEFTLKDVPGVSEAGVNYATGRATRPRGVRIKKPIWSR